MSDTPKTDRVLKNCNGWHHVPIEFAREQELRIAQLERELSEANDKLELYFDDLVSSEGDARHTILSLRSQLTAHKAALEKCEKALVRSIDGTENTGFRWRQQNTLVADAIAAIKQLKQQ